MPRRFTAVLLLLLGGPLPIATAGTLTTYRVAPSDVDPAIERYNEPHVVIFDREADPAAKLLLFMPGTGASPADVDEFLTLAATLGYRVVSLSYNNRPAVANVCPKDPDADCSAKFRRKRIFGEDVTAHIDDKPEESIVRRLVTLLGALDKKHPAEKWGQYIVGDSPRWDRIAVSGHSQGAGMAAYIAQRKEVARVVLLSGPEDLYRGQGAERLAPWVRDANRATPAALWFAAYHKNEGSAERIALAYQALNVPEANVRVLALEPAEGRGNNPNHASVVMSRETPRNEKGGAAYEDDWRFLLGSPD
jgi:hypothetical protein